MRSAVTVCLVPQARQGPFVFHDGLADGCARAAKFGFDAVEVFPPSAAELNVAELKSLLAKHHLNVAAVGTGAGMIVHQLSLTSPNAETRAKARAFIDGIIDVAGAFEAPAILGSMQGRVDAGASRDQALAWLGEALDAFGARAAKFNVPFLYEALNRYETNIFNRQRDAAEFLKTLKTKNIRLLCDLFHMSIEEASLPDALRECWDLVGHVHFADSNRRAVGLGHTDIAPVINALRVIGYKGYLSAEVFPLPDADAAAWQTMDSFQRFAGTCHA